MVSEMCYLFNLFISSLFYSSGVILPGIEAFARYANEALSCDAIAHASLPGAEVNDQIVF